MLEIKPEEYGIKNVKKEIISKMRSTVLAASERLNKIRMEYFPLDIATREHFPLYIATGEWLEILISWWEQKTGQNGPKINWKMWEQKQ